jgi:hypothetical protein
MFARRHIMLTKDSIIKAKFDRNCTFKMIKSTRFSKKNCSVGKSAAKTRVYLACFEIFKILIYFTKYVMFWCVDGKSQKTFNTFHEAKSSACTCF